MQKTPTPDPGCQGTRHGTESAYVNHGCKCEQARRAASRARERRRLRGSPGRVDVTGTQRRLRALIVCGWWPTELARRAGCSHTAVRFIALGRNLTTGKPMRTVRATTAERIAELYDELHAVDPPPVHGRVSAIAAEFLVTHGRQWVGPERWTDETIDNPAARCVPASRHGRPPRHEIDQALVARLVAQYGRTPSAQQIPRFPTSAEVTAAAQWNRRRGLMHEEGVRIMHDALRTLDPDRQYAATKRMYDRHAYEVAFAGATHAA